MTKLPSVFVLLLLSSLSASAQQAGPGAYRFDNYDVPGGVRRVDLGAGRRDGVSRRGASWRES